MTLTQARRWQLWARLLRIGILTVLLLGLCALSAGAQPRQTLEQAGQRVGQAPSMHADSLPAPGQTAAAPVPSARELAAPSGGAAQPMVRQVLRQVPEEYLPQLHGHLRGKYEYQPETDASRFEVRNARLSVEGRLPLRSQYKLEVDLCDESVIKMKDAWVRLLPWRTLRVSVGQQRLPFTIDAHRNPTAQYFANRSFIAKQVGDMRDVGAAVGYTWLTRSGRPLLLADAGLFNGSNIENERTAWHSDWCYSARLQFFPCKGLAIVPSLQHTATATRTAHFTSLDLGAWWEGAGLHLEAEYLLKRYQRGAFGSCPSVNAMAVYTQRLPQRSRWAEKLSYLLRYDYMGDHSDGRKGYATDDSGQPTTRLALTDYKRHRATVGLTLSLRNPYFPTDLRLNYERYWYRHGAQPKESELDKLVAEVAIRF